MTGGAQRFGERVGDLGVSFRCAACGEVAGVVRLTPAGTKAHLGPPIGYRAFGQDGAVVDLFGGTGWRALDAAAFAELSALVSGEEPDPAELRRIDWELAPFFCATCELNYCWADWGTEPVYDGMFYDHTVGHCPQGHRQLVDD